MSGVLLVCTGCERHVKNGDCICPFCGTKVDCLPGPTAKAPSGISRSALMALGAAGALSTAVASCAAAGVVAVYGGPPIHDPGSTGSAGGAESQTATATGQGGSGSAVPDAGKD
jgi:hypothetical protein